MGYTGVFNVIDYPAVSFPSRVKAHKEQDRANIMQPLSDMCATIQGLCGSFGYVLLLTSLTVGLDNEEAVHDMPVNLQLVARRLEEEKVLMMTEVILEAL